jgi:hypothetical protein
MMRFPKFQFYEIVSVSSMRPPLAEIHGQTGAILGMTEDDEGQFYYGVFIDQEEMCWSIAEHDLTSTGLVLERSVFYDDRQSLRGRAGSPRRAYQVN